MDATSNFDNSKSEHPSGYANHAALNLDSENFPMDRYEPISEIGKGSAGIVYVCRDRLLDKLVAIKCLHSITADQLMGFQAEAIATSLIKHVGVVAILDLGVTAAGAPYMVMEYADGKTLEQRIKDKGPLSTSLATKVFVRIASALEYAHSKGIYHRDLKSSNILILDENPTNPDVRLIDFGVARLKQAIQAATVQGLTIVGTPAYMPPDQAAGLPYDAQSEIYAFGCTMFEGLTGRTPFVGETALEIIAMHARDIPPTLSQARSDIIFSEELESIIQICLAKKKSDRFGSMSDLVNALTMLDTGEGLGEASGSPRFGFGRIEIANDAAKSVRKPKRMLVVSLLVAAVAAPIAILFLILWQPKLDHDAEPAKRRPTVDFSALPPKIAVQLKPKSKRAVDSAWKLIEQNKPKQAVLLCTQAMDEDRNNLRALDVRAVAYLAQGNLNEALSDLNKCILRRSTTEQDDASAYFHRALVHQRLGDLAASRSDFRAARMLGSYKLEAWEEKRFSVGVESWSEALVRDYGDRFSRGLEHQGGVYRIANGDDNELTALFKPQVPPVEELYLRRGIYSGRCLSKIHGLSSLKRLELQGLPIVDQDLSFLTVCEHLEKLEISQCGQITGSCLKYLSSLKCLRSIQLEDARLADENFKFLKNNSSLRTVHVARCPSFAGYGFSYLSNSVDRIDWYSASDKHGRFCPINYSQQTFDQLSKLPNLNALSLSADSMDDTAYSALLKVTRLRSLLLEGKQPLHPAQVEKLKNLPHLQRLDFRSVGITSEVMESIGMCKQLQKLFFIDTSLDDKAVATLARLPLSLKRLRLKVPNLDLSMLVELEKLKLLKQLTLDDLSPEVTRAALARLKNAIPDCQIQASYIDGRSFEL